MSRPNNNIFKIKISSKRSFSTLYERNLKMILFKIFRIWHRCGESCSTGSSLPMDCDPAYGPSPNTAAAAAAALGSIPTDEAARRSDSLPLDTRPGGSLTGQASMSSQTSQQLILQKPPPSSLATIASRLAPQDSVDKSPRPSLCSLKSQAKELPIKAKVRRNSQKLTQG